MELREARLDIIKIKAQIERLFEKLDGETHNIQCDFNNLDENFMRDQYIWILCKLQDAYFRMDYISKPVTDQGFIKHNDSGRYELPSGYYFTSGNQCEILDEKYGEQEWRYTTIEHNGENYYATVLGKNVSINGKMVRVRR